MFDHETNRRFFEIVGNHSGRPSDLELRMSQASSDVFLRVAVHDQLSAEVGSLFAAEEEREGYRSVYEDACQKVLTVLAQLQHEYGLTDEEGWQVVELCRINLQERGQLFD
ncbi:hypothetical protein CL689_01380 [Candidatus Saccharibacteria bacterium]|nr:hypothetical protein [Candidatus Saccharibacteria bacterium]MBJ58390.1 hypothetical protein [Candidatus Saccharibacteria bacterium]MBQ68702.1 hypothetical protein [Candidatus Saccharibacteria bacterium]|tara:strand:+ start:3254 stop:3586 length:333 start_codon:yes stop_codon:yes gene_type:complete